MLDRICFGYEAPAVVFFIVFKRVLSREISTEKSEIFNEEFGLTSDVIFSLLMEIEISPLEMAGGDIPSNSVNFLGIIMHLFLIEGAALGDGATTSFTSAV